MHKTVVQKGRTVPAAGGRRISSISSRLIFLRVTCTAWACTTHVHPNRVKRDMATETGFVKWFNDGNGFGLITPASGGKALSAHYSESQGTGYKSLAETHRVEFEVKEGPKGLQASNIRAICPPVARSCEAAARRRGAR